MGPRWAAPGGARVETGGKVRGDSGEKLAANRGRMGRPGAAGAGRGRFGLTGSSQVFDPRVVAIRPDLADIAAAGTYFAPHYAAPMMRSGVLPAAALRASPSLDADQTSELLRSEEHTSELQSLMRISYAVF